MPEGPSIVILKELVKDFKGKKIITVDGNTKQPVEQFAGRKIIDFKSWGKHFLICYKGLTIRIHFLLFGSYRINEEKPNAKPRLHLQFPNGFVNFYACALQILEGDIDDYYDWSGDVMNDEWSPRKATEKLKAHPNEMVCDALLNQDIFAGVGNIIKNEVLFRIRVHPESFVGKLPQAKRAAMVREARAYSFQFLEWKKAYVLKKHWLAHTKKTCSRCHIPLVKEYLGKTNRRSFFCTNCQVLYR